MGLTINLNKCDGCGLCADKCLTKVLILREVDQADYNKLNFIGRLKVKVKGKLKAYVINEAACIGCKTCQNNCHEKAIKVVDY